MRNWILIFALVGAALARDGFTDESALTRWKLNRALQQSSRDMLPEQTWYDVLSYSLDVEIFPSSETVDGQVTIEIEITAVDVTEIILDSADHLNIEQITAEGLDSYTQSDDRLHLYFTPAMTPGEIVSIEIQYSGDTNSGYIWSGGIVYSGGYFWSLGCPYGLHKWVPCKDHPSDKANWIDLRLTVPDEYVIAANGARIGVTDNGDGTATSHWHESYPIATYLFCFNAYPYNEYVEDFEYGDGQTMPIMYFVPTTVPSGFTYVETALPIYSDLFGLYPFVEEKYAIAKVTANFGAMEHQNCVSTSVTNGMTMVHELAHQWFGDMVTPKTWQHSWLNEGFATYCEALYMEQTDDLDAYHNYMNGMEWSWNDNLSVFVTDTTDFAPIFNSIVYDKGAWVNHMLRGVVGDEVYFDAVRDYLDTFAFGNVDTDDLKEIFEAHYGEDLDWFFDEWVYWNGHPAYNYQWASSNDTFYLIVDQENSGDHPDFFTMPVEFELNFSGGESIVQTFWIEGEQSAFEMDIPTAVESVVCDPDNWVLNTANGSGTTEFSMGTPEVSITDTDGNGYVDPGEAFQLSVQVMNMGIPAGEMTGTLSTDHAGVSIYVDQVQFSGSGLGAISESLADYELMLSTDFATSMVEFELHLAWGEYEDTVSFTLPLGTPHILMANVSFQDELTSLYAAYCEEAGLVIHIWDWGSAMTLQELIPMFENILYFTGDNTVDPINEAFQPLLAEHRAQGRNLLVMGQGIGDVLGSTDFYADVLQAQYQGEYEGYIIYGNDDSPVIQGENMLITHPEDCDILEPLGNASMAYEYSGGNGVAGVISESPGNLLYMGFDLSKIINTGGWGQSPAEFLTMVMNWFYSQAMPGDVNGDDVLDVLDIVVSVNIIMGIVDPSPYQLNAGDLNDDGTINVLDVIQMVNLIIG